MGTEYNFWKLLCIWSCRKTLATLNNSWSLEELQKDQKAKIFPKAKPWYLFKRQNVNAKQDWRICNLFSGKFQFCSKFKQCKRLIFKC